MHLLRHHLDRSPSSFPNSAMDVLSKLHILAIFLSVAVVVASQKDLCPEDYWKAMLPDTAMPNSLKELLPQAWREAKHSALTHRHATVNPTDLHTNPTASLYFTEKDLHPGKKLNVQFTASEIQAPFLPRHDFRPFSSQSLQEIFDRLSLDPSSAQAAEMTKTLKNCEQSANSGDKICATSLESLVDFAVSKLGKHVEAVSTDAEDSETRKEYTIVAAKKMNENDTAVLPCHRRKFAYALFYCHMAKPTVVYKVSMVAGDGSKAEAGATCHRDTSKWNNWNLAFQVLKMKPGEGTVCHFQPMGDLVWVPN